jgi:diaminopimelate decarboxylase
LYSAWQNIIPCDLSLERESATYDVVGPICETGDFIGKDRELSILANDLLAVRSAGAYGFVMSSNYNSRCRPPEILVDGDKVHVVRTRETLDDIWKGESTL